MASKWATRRLEVFVLNGHIHDEVVDYLAIMEFLKSVPDPARLFEGKDVAIGIPIFHRHASPVFSFTAYEGTPGEKPLLFNLATGEARVGALSSKEILAKATHGVIDLRNRNVIVEYNHRGAKAFDIIKILRNVARRDERFKDLELEIIPMASLSFWAAVNALDRIREAKVVLSRPNIDWDEDFKHEALLKIDESAHTVDLSVRASAGRSLNKAAGVLKMIKHLITKKVPSLKSAVVTGDKAGQTAEERIPLNKYFEHDNVRVSRDRDGIISDLEIQKELIRSAHRRANDQTDSNDPKDKGSGKC